MATTHKHLPSRVLSLFAAGLVLVVVMLGHSVLLAPHAKAYCYPTNSQDQTFVALLDNHGIGPASGYTWCDLAAKGRAVGRLVASSYNPLQTAASIAHDIWLNSEWQSDTPEIAQEQPSGEARLHRHRTVAL